MNGFETWLTPYDVDRLYRICNGDLTEGATSENELMEFQRYVDYIAQLKRAGKISNPMSMH